MQGVTSVLLRPTPALSSFTSRAGAARALQPPCRQRPIQSPLVAGPAGAVGAPAAARDRPADQENRAVSAWWYLPGSLLSDTRSTAAGTRQHTVPCFLPAAARRRAWRVLLSSARSQGRLSNGHKHGHAASKPLARSSQRRFASCRSGERGSPCCPGQRRVPKQLVALQARIPRLLPERPRNSWAGFRRAQLAAAPSPRALPALSRPEGSAPGRPGHGPFSLQR